MIDMMSIGAASEASGSGWGYDSAYAFRMA